MTAGGVREIRVSGAAVRTEDLGMRYGKKWALRGLDLEVFPGEIFGFLGPNGAGKTTTVKLLAGLMKPSSGRSSLFGEDSLRASSHRNIGYAPENPYIYDYLTPLELLDFFGRIQGMPAVELGREAEWALDAVGLLEARHLKIKTFSKGMKGRIALAQALLGRPPLLFLDEPTSGQDPLARMAIRNLILWYRDNGGTVFLNSHILTDVERICDRVAILNRGKLVRLGSLEELGGKENRLVVETGSLPGQVQESLNRLGKRFREVPGGLEIEEVSRDEVPALSRILVGSGAEIYGLSLQGRSLEEFFVEAVAADEQDGDTGP